MLVRCLSLLDGRCIPLLAENGNSNYRRRNSNVQPLERDLARRAGLPAIPRRPPLRLQLQPRDQYLFLHSVPLTSKNANLKLQEEDITTKLRVGQTVLENTVKLHFVTNARNDENCIVYLHGLSSYCLEGKFLVPYLASSFSLCLYDSRSHGKNQASFVTYGLLESLELRIYALTKCRSCELS